MTSPEKAKMHLIAAIILTSIDPLGSVGAESVLTGKRLLLIGMCHCIV